MKVTVAGLGLICAIYIFAINSSVQAQIKPDSTLNTKVSGNQNYIVTDGTSVGNNLFHSFSEFSVPNDGSVTFSHSSHIQNIFSRITGNSVSYIDGAINAHANLFLLNPSGIIFGKNASLNINGSFVATTANSIKFADGVEFSAVNPTSQPLLTMTVPIGLQMGNYPAPIQVQGTGHLLNTNSSFSPLIANPSLSKLQIQSGKTLALVGGNLTLAGATLSAGTGQIELGSLGGSGLVSLVPTTQGYRLEYEQGQIFADIQLAQKSLLDVSGFNAGAVQLQGRNIEFTDGSLIFSQNYGSLAAGEINLRASAAIAMIGTTSDGKIRSWIRAEALAKGASANIDIITPRLTLQNGSGINAVTYGTANSGNIQIQAADIELSGFSPFNTSGVTSIATSTYGKGSAGDISIDGNSLLVSSGSALSSVTFGSGSSGKVTIRNQNTTISGENIYGLYSNISLTSFATGNTKDLTLDTGKLQILEGGAIGASTFFAGNGGNVHINAREAIAISGQSANNRSSINSSVLRLSPQLREFFTLPNILTANAGSVTINTPKLLLTDGGTVSVTSQGTGNGGNLQIAANQIQLKNRGLIQAQTESGNGGNISLQVGGFLLLRDRSHITATASSQGNGGNININAPIITGLENSDIIANAVQGRGGNIQITTQGMIGLQFRSELTPDNDITASSEFGVNGKVDIHNIGVDPNSGLVELPENVTDPSQQIATGCSNTNTSSFVATGRGGIPQNPTQQVRSDRTWSDIRNISAFHNTPQIQVQAPIQPQIPIQATSWHRNPQGNIELIADQSPVPVPTTLTCAATPQS
ncbi:filamentous hemagglutinin [Nostoc sp. CENA543]|uniref:beta strand repeat-containing protein n=1 Tax=Nostoc sp. CENA543 TaxID=1869241 RepID=UPI000CA1D9A8|nr:S-layer family protein [Nostoc sp. CENA543]AUT00552.1 filamentous hemagglutinin [Nostoc sp. CENA543]